MYLAQLKGINYSIKVFCFNLEVATNSKKTILAAFLMYQLNANLYPSEAMLQRIYLDSMVVISWATTIMLSIKVLNTKCAMLIAVSA